MSDSTNKQSLPPDEAAIKAVLKEAIEEAIVEKSEASSSGKPKAVLDELDKLKEASNNKQEATIRGEEALMGKEASENKDSCLSAIEDGAVKVVTEELKAEADDAPPLSQRGDSFAEGANDEERGVNEKSPSFVETDGDSKSNRGALSGSEKEGAEAVAALSSDDTSDEARVSDAERINSSDENKEAAETGAESAHESADKSIKSSKWGFFKSFFVDLLFLVICAVFLVGLFKKWFVSQEVMIRGANQFSSSIESGEEATIGNVNVLIMGVDSVEGTHRSDTIFVLGMNPSKNKMTMLSIPRDTRVVIEGKARKINEILPRYGEAMICSIIEDLLKITLNRRAVVGFESFISVIDTLGGIDINIEKAMDYDDNRGNLHIHFKPGMNRLDGKNALNYVRFRKDAMADLGRIKRQQEFVKLLVKKLMSPSSIVKLPTLIERAFKYVETDFTLSEILTLVKGFKSFDIKFTTISLPGEARYIDKISYFMPYSEEAVAIGNTYFSDLAVFELEKPFDSGRIFYSKTDLNRKR